MTNLTATLRRYFVTLPVRFVKRSLPKGLFGRTLLIIVIPTFLALTAATFVFFDRHWYMTTVRLTASVAGDIGAVINLLEKTNDPTVKSDILQSVETKMDMRVDFAAGKNIPRRTKPYASPLREILRQSLNERLDYPHIIDMRRAPAMVNVQVETPEGVYSFLIPQRRIYTPTTEVFIGWMIGSSILLSAIALLFMRNQVRPVRRLAEAAEAIGKGQDVPWFKPEGATEVRQASAALMVMRDRLRRAMNQRTTMLAGVSHDLRTPLTRMKLQLAMMPESAQTRGFQSDIADMEQMLEAYLAFARGEEAEAAVPVKLHFLLEEIVESAKRQNPAVTLTINDKAQLTLRPHAMKRCLSNLVSNALRYGKQADVIMDVRDDAVDIFIDDNGPGIPEDKREEVFRPFFRLDASRNLEKGGVGLGLTIARDIARAHGGDVSLAQSPSGGLRAHVWLPT